MFRQIAILTTLVAVAFAGCTPEQFRQYRNFKDGVATTPCERPTTKCTSGVQPYETVTPESKCCVTCFIDPPSGDHTGAPAPSGAPTGGHDGPGAHTPSGAAEPPKCTSDQLAACRAKLEAKSIPKCTDGEVSTPTECCISCVPSNDVVSACREKGADELRALFAALPVCAEGEEQKFNPATCVPQCRQEKPVGDACTKNADEVNKCLAQAAPCVPGNLREQQVGEQGCCMACRPGGEFAITRTPEKFRKCAQKDAPTYRECAADEVGAKVEGSDCPSCIIPAPVCDPACAAPNPDGTTTEERVGQRCAYRFNGADISERTATCVDPLLKRFCFAVTNETRREELSSMAAEELAVELKSLVSAYCATPDSHRYCKFESILNNVMLGLKVEEFDQDKLCFNIALPPMAKVLTAEAKAEFDEDKADADAEGGKNDDSVYEKPEDSGEHADGDDDAAEPSGEKTEASGTRKRADSSSDDFAVIDAAVGSDYAKQSSGISGAAATEDASGAATLTVSTMLVGAAAAVVLLL